MFGLRRAGWGCFDMQEPARGTGPHYGITFPEEHSASIGSDYVRNTIFYGSVGILFTAFGASQLKWLGLQAVVYLLIGLALVWAAVANYLESRKYK
jgi:hypothetical protein